MLTDTLILTYMHTQILWHKSVLSYVGDSIKGRVSPDAQVRAGDVVGDGGGDHHHGNTKLWVSGTSCLQLQQTQICLQ